MPARGLGALLLALASGAVLTPATAHYVPRAELAAAAQSASLHAKTLPDEAQLAAELWRARVQLAGSPLQAEATLHATLLRLRETLRPLPMTRAAVAQLVDYASLIRTDAPDPDHGRGQTAIAFAIAASARGTLRSWDLTAAEAQIAQGLRVGHIAALPQAVADRAWARTIAGATPTELDALHALGLPDAPAALLAAWQRRPDADLATRLLALPVCAQSYALLSELPIQLPAPTARELLIDAERQSALISAARLALAPLVASDAAARQHLLDTLGDTEGASSAQALAASGDNASLSALQDLIATAPEGPRLHHALLALRAMQGDAARALLRSVANDAARSEGLRAEVAAWLR